MNYRETDKNNIKNVKMKIREWRISERIAVPVGEEQSGT